MSVSYYGYAQSHNDTLYSANQTSFNWMSGAGTPRGVLVFVFSISATAQDTGVTYGGQTMSLVSGGEANDTATEPGTVRTYFLGTGLPTGSQSVVVSRVNNATQMWAVCLTFNAANDTEPYGVLIQEENGTFAARSVDDGSPGVNSVRAAAGYSGGSNILAAATGSNVRGSNDLGAYTCTVAVESTPGQGARNVGFTYATSDDRAYVALAVREIVPQPDTPPDLVGFAETSWTTTGSPKSTGTNISWLNGDLIVAVEANADAGGATNDLPTPTATGLSFAGWGTQIRSSSHCQAASWTASPTADGGPVPVSFSNTTGVSGPFGGAVFVFRNHGGPGARATEMTAALVVSLTRLKNHSKIIEIMADWGAGATTGYSFVPAPVGNDRQHSKSGTDYTYYLADWNDQGDAGTANYGVSGVSGNGVISKIVLEIFGIYVGSVIPTFSGNLRMKKMFVSGSGGGLSDITGNLRMKKMRLSGSGAGVSDVTGSFRMKKMFVSGTGTKVSAVSGDLRMKKMRLSGSGAGVSDISGDIRMKKMSLSGTGTIIAGVPTFSGDLRMKKAGLSGTGAGISSITGTFRMKKMFVTASGAGISVVSGNLGMKKMRAAGSGSGISVVTGTIRMKKMGVSGTGTTISVITGNLRMKKMSLSGTGSVVTPEPTFSGDLRMKKMRLSGSATVIGDISGDLRLKKMRLSGSGTGISAITGDLRLKKIRVAGSISQLPRFSGAILLKKMILSGSGEGISDISGDLRMHKMHLQGEEARRPASDMFVFSQL